MGYQRKTDAEIIQLSIQPTNEAIETSQPINQPINQLINQQMDQLINQQPINQLTQINSIIPNSNISTKIKIPLQSKDVNFSRFRINSSFRSANYTRVVTTIAVSVSTFEIQLHNT